MDALLGACRGKPAVGPSLPQEKGAVSRAQTPAGGREVNRKGSLHALRLWDRSQEQVWASPAAERRELCRDSSQKRPLHFV